MPPFFLKSEGKGLVETRKSILSFSRNLFTQAELGKSRS
jgi:hypothetical protein